MTMLVRAGTALAIGSLVATLGLPALAGPPEPIPAPASAPAAPPAPPPPAGRPVTAPYRPPAGGSSGTVHAAVVPANAPKLKPVGMVGIKSSHGRYLQAHTDGELHASNEHRNTEETWVLIPVDKAQHVYALQNYRTANLMTKRGGCAPANSTTLGASERWIMVSGRPFNVNGAVAFKNFSDGSYLVANGPGNDDPCGGEVAAHGTAAALSNPSWGGWWKMEPATTPTAGHDVWSTTVDAVGTVVHVVASVAGAVVIDLTGLAPVDPVTLYDIVSGS